MQILLVRHAEAAPGDPDELRPLTPVGEMQARALGRRLREAGVTPDTILTSPLVRARETAAILGVELGAPVQPDERLAPGADARAVTDAVAGWGETVVVVGHQPDCSRIAAALTGEAEPAFPPAGAVSVQLTS